MALRAISEFISELRVENAKSFSGKWSRLMEATGANSDSALARTLEILPQSVTAARNRKKIPGGWVEIIAEKCGVSADWLFFGKGSMNAAATVLSLVQPAVDEVTKLQERITELEAENHRLEKELYAKESNIQVYKDAMETLKAVALKMGVGTTDASASATSAPSTTLTSDK
jgi:uncharacterized small protein (DUF1192 family)